MALPITSNHGIIDPKIRNPFKVISSFKPDGDQPEAITKLVKGVNNKEEEQVLLGVTGSGKTFTMAKVIEAV